jgi:hypothetical protein
MGHGLLFRKDLMGCAALHPSYGPTASQRQSFTRRRGDAEKSQWDVKSCYEKAAHKGLEYGSVRRLFMVWGFPQGHEMLR